MPSLHKQRIPFGMGENDAQAMPVVLQVDKLVCSC